MKFTASDEVDVKIEGNLITVDPRGDSKRARAMWGTSRSMIQNLVVGVTKGFEKKLEINGVGYKAAVAGKNLQLSLGFSHDVIYPIPAGVTIVDARSPRKSRSPASTSGRSARSPRKSGRFAGPSPTRARA